MLQCPEVRTGKSPRLCTVEATKVDADSRDVSKSGGNVIEGKPVRIRRANTAAEKNKIKRGRKARMRQLLRCGTAEVIKELAQVKSDHDKCKKELKFNQKLSQLYWDRWRHEVQERKCRKVLPSLPSYVALPQISKSALLLSNDGEGDVVGRGSFGIVRHMMYRGIDVAVKSFDSDCSRDSVICEASFLSKLNHPNLPLLFGYNVLEHPHYIVTQFYGIDGKSVTIHKELASPSYVRSVEEWVGLCVQVADAIRYLHIDAHCLHNDIKSDNVLLTKSQATNCSGKLSVVLIDFNKATKINDGRRHNLLPHEKTLHYTHHPHLAPEVIEGTLKQTCASDIFAVGRVLKQIAKRMSRMCDKTELWSKLQSIASNCSSEDVKSRPSALVLTNDLKKLLNIE